MHVGEIHVCNMHHWLRSMDVSAGYRVIRAVVD